MKPKAIRAAASLQKEVDHAGFSFNDYSVTGFVPVVAGRITPVRVANRGHIRSRFVDVRGVDRREHRRGTRRSPCWWKRGDDSGLSDAAAVADADLIGTEAGASFLFSDDNKVFKIGYKGTKRYVRVTITPANNGAGNIYPAGVWIKGHPRTLPKTSQLVS